MTLCEKLLNRIFLAILASLLLAGVGNQAFAQYDEKLVILKTNLGTIVIEF